MTDPTRQRLLLENEELRRRLEEATATIRALRDGEVDAVVVGTEQEQVYTLDPVDRPYRLMVDRIPQAAAAIAPEGTIIHCNSRFADLVQRPLAALIGEPIVKFVAADQLAQLDTLVREGREQDCYAELGFIRGDDTPISMFLCASALREGARGATIVLTDHTEQRRYEELQQAQSALRASERALRNADRRKDEFLATLAHELRNPLAPIRNAVQILKVKGGDDPDLSWARDVLDRQATVMARLLEDLLDVSRIARDTLALRREDVALGDVLKVALETSMPRIAARGHDINVQLPREPLYVNADPVRLAQVFSNLLNNAATYSEEGSQIQLEVLRENGNVVVSVKDSGIGIPVDVLPVIFEIFQQGRPASMRSQGGLGVGLSLVKRLVDLHGGQIEARSDGPGRGSEFIVRLDVVTAPMPVALVPDRHGDERDADVKHTHRILVVDDNVDSAETLAMFLRAMGNDVATAYDGVQALEAAESLRPDVMLLDIGMPRLNGYETCAKIRAREWGARTRLIAVTGWGQEEDLRRTKAAGFDGHIVKPVDPDVLVAYLERLDLSEGGNELPSSWRGQRRHDQRELTT